jgi:uncharacterized membrane protein
MSKGKVQHTQARAGGTAVQQVHAEFDDSPLPPSQELERYSAIRPDLVDFFKEMSKAEMAHRHDIVDREIKLKEGGAKKLFTIDILTLLFAFSIIMGGGVATFYFVTHGFAVASTLFGGATIVLAVRAFLNFKSIRVKK